MGLALRMRGIDWPKMHPDEYPVARWVQHGQPDRLYAGGFFVMVQPLRWVYDLATLRMDYFRGSTDTVGAPIAHYIMFTRLVNVWLGSLACIFIYLVGKNVTGSRWAGILAALLFALSQYPIEHSHYGETDIGMVFALTVGLWLWSEAVTRTGRLWLPATAFVLGFAVGTKFVLAAILPVFWVYCLLQHGGPLRWRQWRKHVSNAVWGAAVSAAGLVAATPRLLRWDKIGQELAHEKSRLFHETAANMGVLAGDTAIRYRSHIVALGRFMLSMGWGWIVLVAMAAPLALTKRYRRYAVILVMFPAAYLVYWVFGAPWIRHQEFMNFLPVFAALAAVSVTALWRTRSRLAQAAVVLLVCAAVLETGIYGFYVSSIFGWKDTRLLAERWVRRHEPQGVTYAREKYAAIGTQNHSIDILTIEEHGIDQAIKAGADYLLSTEMATGRGIVHPITGERYPVFEEHYQDFLSGSERLCSWSMLPPFRTRSGFNSWNIALFRLAAPAAAADLDVVLPQPVFLSSAGRETYFPVGHGLGSATGITVDRYARTVAIGGPERIREPVYVVLNTRERDADVHVAGLGRRKRVHLDPYDVSIVPLKPPAWRPLPSHWATIRARAKPVKDIVHIPCFMRVAFSRGEVLRILCELGRPDKLADVLTLEGGGDGCSPMVLFRTAVGAGDWAVAEESVRGAREAAAVIKRTLDGKGRYRIAGISDGAYDQFARIRLVGPEAQALELWPERGAGGQRTGPPRADLPFPVLAAGQCELVGEWSATGLTAGAGTNSTAEFLRHGSDNVLATLDILPPGTDRFGELHLPIRGGVETRVRLELVAPVPARVRFRNVELRWSARAQLEAEYVAWLLCLAEYEVARQEYAKALAALQECPGTTRPDHELRRLQLAFEIAGHGAGADPENRTRAAAELLRVAPDHYAALDALAATRPDLADKAARLSSISTAAAPVFRPFFSVVGASLASDPRRLTLVLEALRNETPGFSVGVHLRRSGKWRRQRLVPISPARRLARGERASVLFALGGELGSVADLNGIGISVESSVRWHPRKLPVEGRMDRVVPFGELCE